MVRDTFKIGLYMTMALRLIHVIAASSCPNYTLNPSGSPSLYDHIDHAHPIGSTSATPKGFA
jgi:hypothetical protein